MYEAFLFAENRSRIRAALHRVAGMSILSLFRKRPEAAPVIDDADARAKASAAIMAQAAETMKSVRELHDFTKDELRYIEDIAAHMGLPIHSAAERYKNIKAIIRDEVEREINRDLTTLNLNVVK